MIKRKYGNVRVTVDGHNFDSKREARRYGELKLLQKAGKISALEVHPRYDIHVNDEKVCAYVADFAYKTFDGKVVEDVKGVRTAIYRLKKKLMFAVHGIAIAEVK